LLTLVGCGGGFLVFHPAYPVSNAGKQPPTNRRWLLFMSTPPVEWTIRESIGLKGAVAIDIDPTCFGVTAKGSTSVALARKNARMMAAAPDMLAAIEGLFEHCAMVHKRWGEGHNQREADAAIKAAHAAIAKARGHATAEAGT
jgi:hypothetical protein